jgi:hypothetical protein
MGGGGEVECGGLAQRSFGYLANSPKISGRTPMLATHPQGPIGLLVGTNL